MAASATAPSGPTRRSRRPWRHPRLWSLRTRLLAALLALLAAVSLVIGLVSVVALNQFLMGRLDDQLTAAGLRSQGAQGRPGGPGDADDHGGRSPGFLLAPGQAEGTLGARLVDGQVQAAGVLSRRGDPLLLVESQARTLLAVPVDGRLHTRNLGGSLHEYRLIAAREPDGDVIVTGLPLGGVHATVYRLAAVAGLVALAGLLVAGLAGAAIIRLALQPLRRVAATARRVSELSLDKGEVALAVRVPEEDTNPTTEVGQVGHALNLMLGNVAGALAARQASETRVRTFVADASHELRTPLAAIRGYAELTRPSRDSLPPDVAHALTRIESQTVRMSTLVGDLLQLARLDAGRRLDRKPVDLSRLVVDAVTDAQAAGRGHTWTLDLPQDPLSVSGDANALGQVLDNLLTNARVHTPPGTTVLVGLGAVVRDGSPAVELRVTDDGPGIPADVMPDVFDRFSRGDTSRSRAAGSSGLGLAIVQAIVHEHGGDVAVTSVPGRTSFTVALPRLADEMPGQASEPLTVTAQEEHKSDTEVASTIEA